MATQDSNRTTAPPENEQQYVGIVCGPQLFNVTFHGDEALCGDAQADYIESCLLDVFDVARSALFDERSCMSSNASAFVGVIELSRMCLGMAIALRAECKRAAAHGYTP